MAGEVRRLERLMRDVRATFVTARYDALHRTHHYGGSDEAFEVERGKLDKIEREILEILAELKKTERSQVVTKGQKFADGIAIVKHFLSGACFYNSSGGAAIFYLARKLTREELLALEALGFEDYREVPKSYGPKMVAKIEFTEWSEE